jgi:chlorite dismutase
VTPPGYVHEYGDTRAMRIEPHASGAPDGPRVWLTDHNTISPRACGDAPETRPSGRAYPDGVSDRHFVKYTFLQVDPAWRRLDAAQRAQDKREFLAAAEDFGADHLVQSFSLVGTRGDADLMLVAETENLDRIHEFHVVLGQSGLMKWCTQPYSFLGMRKGSEYSEDKRLVPRPFRGKYLFVYPFVKTRPWYALPADERYRVMQNHIKIGRQYPQVDNHTTYSFGLDDQEFVVAFDTDDVGAFLDLVHELRGTEASAYTLRDTPSFTCIRVSLERALSALDGEPIPALAGLS